MLDGQGAHAYTLQSYQHVREASVVGASRNPGDPLVISLLRTEHYGGLSILIWIWILEQRFGPCVNEVVDVHIDNDTVIKV